MPSTKRGSWHRGLPSGASCPKHQGVHTTGSTPHRITTDAPAFQKLSVPRTGSTLDSPNRETVSTPPIAAGTAETPGAEGRS